MAEPTTENAQATALRMLRALEATLDRHAGRPDAERADALAATLREQLAGVPAAERAPAVAALRTLVPEDRLPPPAAPAADAGREAELRAEVARLERALAAASAAPPAAAADPDLLRGLGRVLGLPARDLDALGADGLAGQERLLGALRLLLEFGLGLLRAYIPVTQDEDHTVAGLVQRLVADAVAGRAAGADLAAHVERTRRQVGGQVFAFRRACDEGARGLLKTLAPPVIEAEAGRQASFLEKRFGIAAQCWDLYQKRAEELRLSQELYQTYFDGPLRREMHRLAREGEEGQRG